MSSYLKHLVKLADCELERTLLVFHDPRSFYGKFMLWLFSFTQTDLTPRCVHCMSLYKSMNGRQGLQGV